MPPPEPDTPRSVVVHDYFETTEGGGKLACILAREMGADLACGFKAAAHPYFAELFRGPVLQLTRRGRLPLLRQSAVAWAFLHRSRLLCRYDTAVFSGSYAPLAVLQGGARRNLYYCHTPPRFLYDRRRHFQRTVSPTLRPFFALFNHWYRPRYQAAFARMDRIATNSQNVRRRILRYLGRDAAVVYPPCDTRRFRYLGQEGFYLSAGRLDPLKRVDRIVSAFSRLPEKRLVVVSGGPEERRIRRMASALPNVTVLGPVSESRLVRLMGTCIAVLYIPEEEDFGMVPVEAMAAGKPVIGVREGGVPESVIDGRTGTLLDPDPDAEAVAGAVEAMTAEVARSFRAACEARARAFDTAVFVERMGRLMGG